MKYVWRVALGILTVTGLVVIGAVVWFGYKFANIKHPPAETWVCIDQFGYGDEVVWDAPHPGTTVNVQAVDRVELFGLSCLANTKSNCFDNPGWSAGQIDVRGGPRPFALYFDRESSGIAGAMRHHVDLVDDFAEQVIAAFRTGKVAEIKTIGSKNDVLKTTKIDLAGFGPALDQCIAKWKAKPRR